MNSVYGDSLTLSFYSVVSVVVIQSDAGEFLGNEAFDFLTITGSNKFIKT